MVKNAASELFYEGEFSDVALPHDYVIEQIPSGDNNESHGGHERENAWYRRTFRLNRNDSDKEFYYILREQEKIRRYG